MRIKKILASVLAAAIAVSATAISVSAADINMKASTPVYNATITYTTDGEVGTDGKITFAKPAVDGSEVTGFEVSLSVIADKKVATKTKTQTKDFTAIEFTTSEGPSFDDFSNVIRKVEAVEGKEKVDDDPATPEDESAPAVEAVAGVKGAAWQATVTVKVKSGKAYTANDAFTFKLGAANVTGKLVVNDNTEDIGVPTPISLGGIAKKVKKELADGFSITYAVYGGEKVTTPIVVELKLAGAADGAKDVSLYQTITAGATSIKFDIPAGFAANFDEEWDYADSETTLTITDIGPSTNWDVGFYDANISYDAGEPVVTNPTEPEETNPTEPEETSATADDIDEPADTGAAALVVAPAIISAIATIISKKRK